MNVDDQQNLDDLKDIERAMIEARHALIKAMVGQDQREREAFVFHLGFARGRLMRVCDRVYPAREETADAP
jgi:hypothetical protein